jgi:tetratricopeptide (TPR) repeat protein
MILRMLALASVVSLPAAFITGCASLGPAPTNSVSPALPARVMLKDTPFFAQEQHQCGPASLAMALGAAGYPASPRDLEPLVFLPDREGSLQTEMLVAARRRGALAYVIPPGFDALFEELAAGRPVIVLQNLGLSFASRWHYAVAIGYDQEAQQMILHSGTVERDTMNFRTFGYTWKRSNQWAMVVLPPGQLPLHADARELEKSLAALEKYAKPAQMLRHYEAASQRWPDNLLFRMGIGINAYNAGHLDLAEAAFRAVADLKPDNTAALNNLATVLQDLGRLEEALAVADKAVSRSDQWQGQALATRDGIREAIQKQSE